MPYASGTLVAPPAPFAIAGSSSEYMVSIIMLTSLPLGSVTPCITIAWNLWSGGHRSVFNGQVLEHSSGLTDVGAAVGVAVLSIVGLAVATMHAVEVLTVPSKSEMEIITYK